MQNSIPTWIVAFVTAIGGLLGGVHGALLAFTVASGIAIVLALIGASAMARAQQQGPGRSAGRTCRRAAPSGPSPPAAVPDPSPASSRRLELPEFPETPPTDEKPPLDRGAILGVRNRIRNLGGSEWKHQPQSRR